MGSNQEDNKQNKTGPARNISRCNWQQIQTKSPTRPKVANLTNQQQNMKENDDMTKIPGKIDQKSGKIGQSNMIRRPARNINQNSKLKPAQNQGKNAALLEN